MALRALNKPLLGRYAAVTPVTLFRIQPAVRVQLRAGTLEALRSTRRPFDIELDGSSVAPRDPAEARFLGPNGISMRPPGPALRLIVGTFRAPSCVLYEVPRGTPIPPGLVLLHEHTDHFAMQPAARMPLSELDAALTAFLAQPGVVRFSSKAAFWAAHPAMAPGAPGSAGREGGGVSH